MRSTDELLAEIEVLRKESHRLNAVQTAVRQAVAAEHGLKPYKYAEPYYIGAGEAAGRILAAMEKAYAEIRN